MSDGGNSMSRLVLLLAAVAAIAMLIFVVTGGDLGGTQKVEGDADLPPVTSPAPPENTGSR